MLPGIWAICFYHTQPCLFAGVDATYEKRTGIKILKYEVHSATLLLQIHVAPFILHIGYALLEGETYCLFHRF